MLTKNLPHILQLPLELREQIYAYILPRSEPSSSGGGGETQTHLEDPYRFWHRGSLSLLTVNRQISLEASRLFYSTNAFGLTVHDSGVEICIEYVPRLEEHPGFARRTGSRNGNPSAHHHHHQKRTDLSRLREEHVRCLTRLCVYVPTHYTAGGGDEVEDTYVAWDREKARRGRVRGYGLDPEAMSRWFVEEYFPSMSEARREYREGVWKSVEGLVRMLSLGEREGLGERCVRSLEVDFESYSTPADEAVYEANGPDGKLVKGVVERFPEGLRKKMVVKSRMTFG
ncbi:hypothetical protein LTS18_003011 [Coniosporium uncinatum]|uniref:Uncharacterized protein n=1 Tax=Coniosporium uncinatum TaxID=93489 RepID=A0ACC3DBY3_9PEZI|nr:hypothetical protein LTS18_003011 [Coniosporium uncinatum]